MKATTSRLERALGFDPSPIQGFHRPDTMFFWWGRGNGVVFWAASYFNNGLVCYGDRRDYLEGRLKRAVTLSESRFQDPLLEKTVARGRKRSLKETGFEDHGLVALYAIGGGFSKVAERLTKRRSTFVYREPETLGLCLKNIREFRNGVVEAYRGMPYGPKRRKAVLLFLNLNASACEELRVNSQTKDELVELLASGHRERVYTILTTPQAADLQPEIVKAAQSALFIGEANETLAEKFYGLESIEYEESTVKLGAVWDHRQPGILRRFGGVKTELNPWVIERKAAVKKEESDWHEYLESLDGERT